MNATQPLQPSVTYHIYNRGNNRENLFIESRNYSYFLTLYARYVEPVVDTYAYCLLKNHFHLLVQIKCEDEIQERKRFNLDKNDQKLNYPALAFSNLFNTYAKAINKAYGRTGSLFEERFRRIPITADSYFTNLIFYIHFNPQKHCFVENFFDWKWSSYNTLIDDGVTKLRRDDVINWFGNKKAFLEFHRGLVNEKMIASMIDDAFEQELSIHK